VVEIVPLGVTVVKEVVAPVENIKIVVKHGDEHS